MDEEEFEQNFRQAEDLLDDERIRTRGGFQPSQPGGPQGQGPPVDRHQQGMGPDPGFSAYAPRTNLSPAVLKTIKDSVPNLAHLPDEYLASQPIDALIRANMAAKQADIAGAAKGADGRLNANYQKALNAPVELTGLDNRSSMLHPARFLPGAGVSVQRLWLEARKHLGPEGAPAIGNYDVKAVGCSGCVTAKGWEALHNPGSSELALKLFTVSNVSHVSTGAKTVFLTGEDGLTITDTMKDVADMAELKSALRTLREAASLVMPWNKSFAVLEGFLITHEFFYKELENAKRAMAISNFVDHVLKLNASNWVQETEFLAGGELTAAWDSWIGARRSTYKHKEDDNKQNNSNNQQQRGNNNNSNNNNNNHGNNGNGGRSRGGSNRGGFNKNFGRGGYNQGWGGGGPNGFGNMGNNLPNHNGPPTSDNVCRRFNEGRCPNAHTMCAYGNLRLYHRCNYMVKGQNGKFEMCLQKHPRVEHK